MSNKRVSQRLILQLKFLKISDEFIMVCKYIFFELNMFPIYIFHLRLYTLEC